MALNRDNHSVSESCALSVHPLWYMLRLSLVRPDDLYLKMAYASYTTCHARGNNRDAKWKLSIQPSVLQL